MVIQRSFIGPPIFFTGPPTFSSVEDRGLTSFAESGCGQLDVKYSGKVDISVDKILLFKLFFLGFFSVCLPNIFFNMLEYLSTLDLLSFDKSDL